MVGGLSGLVLGSVFLRVTGNAVLNPSRKFQIPYTHQPHPPLPTPFQHPGSNAKYPHRITPFPHIPLYSFDVLKKISPFMGTGHLPISFTRVICSIFSVFEEVSRMSHNPWEHASCLFLISKSTVTRLNNTLRSPPYQTRVYFPLTFKTTKQCPSPPPPPNHPPPNHPPPSPLTLLLHLH